MKNKEALEQMKSIYGVQAVDWMGYLHRRRKIINIHHIKERFESGRTMPSNGAILTASSHRKLNKLYEIDKSLYEQYNYWFQIINDMRRPPSAEIMKIIIALQEQLETAIYGAPIKPRVLIKI